MFLLRNLSSRPTIFNGSIVMLPEVGGRPGRISETALWILETASAHGDRDGGRVENFRLDGRSWRASSRIWHRGQIEGEASGVVARRAFLSRSARTFMLEVFIDTICVGCEMKWSAAVPTLATSSKLFGYAENPGFRLVQGGS